MKIIYTRHSLIEEINKLREQSLQTGFVPTMGALHKGHLQLIKSAREENDIVVCSIFVNPVQFNNASDLERYPRSPENDIAMVKSYCDILFMPCADEMYPTPPQEEYYFGLLESTMEGQYRPGHFNGVVIVIKRLFDLIQPDIAYFGRKDYQQLAIIKQLVHDYDMKITIRSIDTVREDDGLAMSSRNSLLSPQARSVAPFIWQTLHKAQLLKKEKNPREISNWIREQFNGHESFTLEYAQLINAETLEEVNEYKEGESIVACVAVWLDKVRLIDNITIK
ncbi:MAG: pantoate--beta-alanine ligase [Bacteroidales bacterium]|nr:pantoate--beta-alanine ligase [Bacteroidales bacterium]